MLSTLHCRPERAGDAPGIDRVNELAFGRRDEADLVRELRRNDAVTLSLIADVADKLVGHCLFTPAPIVNTAALFPALALGPVAVLPEWQDRQIGTRLINIGIERLRAAGHEIVVVLGHTTYYPRFGFAPASRFNIGNNLGITSAAFMVLALQPGALERAVGIAQYRPEFSR